MYDYYFLHNIFERLSIIFFWILYLLLNAMHFLVHFQQCRSRHTCFLSCRAECFMFDCINITCCFGHLASEFYLDQCSECLMSFVFEYRLRALVVYQISWKYHLEWIIIIIVIIISYYIADRGVRFLIYI